MQASVAHGGGAGCGAPVPKAGNRAPCARGAQASRVRSTREPSTGRGARNRFRGQAGLEQMLMLGTAIVFVIAAFAAGAAYFFNAFPAAEGRNAAMLLAQEADYACALGRGTARHVSVPFPDGTEYVNISGHAVNVRVQGGGGATDFVSHTTCNVTGGVRDPRSAQLLSVRTLDGGTVQVGDLMLACFPNELVFSLAAGAGANSSVSVVNAHVENITGIAVSHSGPIGDMISYTQPASALAPGASGASLLTVSVPAGKARGAYEGFVICNSTNGGYDTTRIQINVG